MERIKEEKIEKGQEPESITQKILEAIEASKALPEKLLGYTGVGADLIGYYNSKMLETLEELLSIIQTGQKEIPANMIEILNRNATGMEIGAVGLQISETLKASQKRDAELFETIEKYYKNPNKEITCSGENTEIKTHTANPELAEISSQFDALMAAEYANIEAARARHNAFMQSMSEMSDQLMYSYKFTALTPEEIQANMEKMKKEPADKVKSKTDDLPKK